MYIPASITDVFGKGCTGSRFTIKKAFKPFLLTSYDCHKRSETLGPYLLTLLL